MPAPTKTNEFAIGVKLDPNTGHVTEFCHGALDASRAEEIAGRLLALAQALRDESRATVSATP